MEVSKEFCQTILNKIYSVKNYDIIDWKIEGFNQLIGFHGEHCILKIRFNVHGHEKMFSFFVKKASDHPLLFDYLKKIRCFEKEYYMFDGVIDELQSHVDEKLTARCYVNELNKFAVFEDLSAAGYENKIVTDNDLVKSAVEKLAVFHAASFILEEKSGKSISDKFPSICFETIVNNVDTEEGRALRGAFNTLKHFIFEKMDGIPYDEKLELAEWAKEAVLEEFKPSKKYRNVINHGDPWTMNFMYKCTDEGKVEDVLLVDFQVCRIAPPAAELNIFLTLRYSCDELRTNIPTFLTVYYDALSRTLTKAGLEPSKILSKETLQESFDYYRCTSVICKALYTMTIALPQEYFLTINSPEKFYKFMTDGDVESRLVAFENNKFYRESCIEAINNVYKEYLIIKEKN